MWRGRKENLELVDSKIVTRDFIIAEGSTMSYNFLGEKNNPFSKSIRAPIFYLFKVHKNHPLRIFSSSTNFVNIYPAKESKKSRPRMPGEVYRDRMDYDLTTFLFLPFDINLGKSPWKKFSIEEGFSPESVDSIKEYSGSLRENKWLSEFASLERDASLLYAEHGPSIHCQDSFHRVSEVMPSQVINHFFSWLREGKEIYSHEKTFNQRLEGSVKVPLERAREITWEVMNVLEKRYSTRLMFEGYKRGMKEKEKGLRD